MTLLELRDRLEAIGCPKDIYTLIGRSRIEKGIVFEHYATNCWRVYFVEENGIRFSEREFTDESSACDYMYNTLLSYTEHLGG